MTTKLWRYNPTTGFWSIQRICDSTTAKDWLRVYQSDEPGAAFKLSKNRPVGAPRATGQ